jgi:hypothetical protein
MADVADPFEPFDPFDSVNREAAKVEQLAAGVKHAARFLAFEDNPDLRAVFDTFKRDILDRVCPPTASLQEFAYAAGQRALVIGILKSIDLARQGGI